MVIQKAMQASGRWSLIHPVTDFSCRSKTIIKSTRVVMEPAKIRKYLVQNPSDMDTDVDLLYDHDYQLL